MKITDFIPNWMRDYAVKLWLSARFPQAYIEEGVKFDLKRLHTYKIGRGARMYGHCLLGPYLEIGENTYLGEAVIDSCEAAPVKIGANCRIGTGVRILTQKSDLKYPPGPSEFLPVTIGDGTDMGVRVVIMPGITVGEQCKIGAGAVVRSDVPAFSVSAGESARSVKRPTG